MIYRHIAVKTRLSSTKTRQNPKNQDFSTNSPKSPIFYIFIEAIHSTLNLTFFHFLVIDSILQKISKIFSKNIFQEEISSVQNFNFFPDFIFVSESIELTADLPSNRPFYPLVLKILSYLHHILQTSLQLPSNFLEKISPSSRRLARLRKKSGRNQNFQPQFLTLTPTQIITSTFHRTHQPSLHLQPTIHPTHPHPSTENPNSTLKTQISTLDNFQIFKNYRVANYPFS